MEVPAGLKAEQFRRTGRWVREAGPCKKDHIGDPHPGTEGSSRKGRRHDFMKIVSWL